MHVQQVFFADDTKGLKVGRLYCIRNQKRKGYNSLKKEIQN